MDAATTAPTAGGLLLAAGAGTRLGSPKALVELGGERLVERGVRLLTEAGCDPVVVVLGSAAAQVRRDARLGAATAVVNKDWRTGMGSSLRAGLAALPDRVPAVVVALVDQPLVGVAAVERLIAAWREGALVAVATYGGRHRNPVLFDRAVWGAVAATAVGDRGARHYLRTTPEEVTGVPCDGTGSPEDIDTATDLAAVAAQDRSDRSPFS